jgi:alpha-D-ribose 1-methylphosphonate 5-phosphate C-P lyase
VLVNGRHIMAPTPIPRWDVPRQHMAPQLPLFGAGREKRVYAVPPLTEVVPLAFDDHPFCVEDFGGRACLRCGSTATYLVPTPNERGETFYLCSDTDWCDSALEAQA